MSSAEEQFAALTDRARQHAEARAALIQRLAALTVTEVGAQGAIRVTVAASGDLTGLDLTDQARLLPPAHLAAQIMATVRRAQATLARQVVAMADAANDPIATGMAARYRAKFPDQPTETPLAAPRQRPTPRPVRNDYPGDDDFSQQTILRKY